MSKEKVILAYSGGLDTSVAITWLKKDYDVIAVCMDVGEGKDLEFIHDKALKVGAVESYVIDVKEEFANDYVLVALQAHAYYEQKYPLVSALSRPLISKKLVEIAHQTGATTIAHGCSGNGLVKKKSNMPKKTVFQFLLTLTILTLSIKIFGDVQMNVVSWKTLGTKRQKKHLESHLRRKRHQTVQNLLTLSLAAGCPSPSMVRR